MEFKRIGSARIVRNMLLLTACGMLTANAAVAQEKRVTLSQRNITVREAIKEIETQTGYVIGFRTSDFDGSKRVTLPRTEGTTKEILGFLLTGSGQTWEAKGDYIVVMPAQQTKPIVAKVEPEPVPAPRKPETVRGVDIPSQTYTFDATPEPQPVPAPRGNYKRASRLTDTPRWSVKTNLLWDATASVNLATEFRVGRKTTIELPISFNYWNFSDERKWKHTLYQPGVRFWTCEAFNGFFWGVHAHYGTYNIGNLPSPPFSDYANTHRYEGWLVGGGVSAGWHWIVGKRWAFEAELGAGYAYLDYKTYRCENCGKQTGAKTSNYWGPTKAVVALVFMIK